MRLHWYALRGRARGRALLIEFMPFADHEGWSRGRYVPVSEVRDRLQRELGIVPGGSGAGSGPAEYSSIPGRDAKMGFIHPVSEHFCAACNRVRLTATGELRPCLGHLRSVSLRDVLRSGGDDAALRAGIADALAAKPERRSSPRIPIRRRAACRRSAASPRSPPDRPELAPFHPNLRESCVRVAENLNFLTSRAVLSRRADSARRSPFGCSSVNHSWSG